MLPLCRGIRMQARASRRFQSVALVTRSPRSSKHPAQIEKMVVQASSQTFRDKFRIGQEVLDSFTIIWSERARLALASLWSSIPSIPTVRHNDAGLGELVRNAVWRKCRSWETRSSIPACVPRGRRVGPGRDFGRFGGWFPALAFEFIKERMKERQRTQCSMRFISKPGSAPVAGMGQLRVPARSQRERSFDASGADVRGGAGQPDARGVASTPNVAQRKQGDHQHRSRRYRRDPAARHRADRATVV